MSGTVALARGGIVSSQDGEDGKSTEGNDDDILVPPGGGGESKSSEQCAAHGTE